MLASLTEINHASEYRNPPSRSFVFTESSINDNRYFVSGILADEEVILVNSNSDGIEQITSALQKYASILGEIDKVCTICTDSSGKQQLASVILSSDYLEPYKSQLPKWDCSLSEKSGLGSCYADRESDTLGNGRARDRLFSNQESDAIIDPINSRSIIIITFAVTAQVLKVPHQRPNNLSAID
ncbi:MULTISPECIES: DUF4347 domain-containing protein [unclassified Microcoleus]|uniref:DUF4347 domain-containing protein n=1 Tax=unclassified Microcoleus TaxID=2642155 RepID=UPI002FD56C3D